MSPKPLAIFDFDGTMIHGDSIIRYVRYAIEKGHEPLPKAFIRLWQGLMALCGVISATKAKTLALSFLGRMTPSEQAEFNHAFCRDVLAPRLFPKALERMNMHRDQGLHILLVSASPDAYINQLKDFMPLDVIMASPTNDQGQVSSSTRGQEKARRVSEWASQQAFEVDWANSVSYGNSAMDLPVMRLTAGPVCINPSRSMKKKAPNWPVERW